MSTDHNPQSAQMVHESMLRTLAAQAEAVWPQEMPLFARYGIGDRSRVLDVACGSGEASRRVLEHWPQTAVHGVDIAQAHVERARLVCEFAAERASFSVGDALALDLADSSYDLTLCRHLIQALPQPERLLAELVRVTKPGGWLHLVAEDYGMMHFAPASLDHDRFWLDGPVRYAAALGTDLHSGRKIPHLVQRLGLVEISVDYIAIDTTRVPRETFARIWEAWRDGYCQVIADNTELTLETCHAHFDDMISAIRDPQGYAVWQLPVISARVPLR